MLDRIIEELNIFIPSYSFESFSPTESLSHPCFAVVDIQEKKNIGRFSHKPLFVYIYAPKKAYTILHNFKLSIYKTLHKQKFNKTKGDGFFWVEYETELPPFIEETVDKLVLTLEFKIPSV